MAIKSRENLIGAWAFLIGVVLSVLVGMFIPTNTSAYQIVLGVLAFLGIVMGYFVAEKDVQTFLFAAVSVVLVSYIGLSGYMMNAALMGISIGKYFYSIFGALISLFVPATIIVALKTVFSIAQN